jgi:hypothetical protein
MRGFVSSRGSELRKGEDGSGGGTFDAVLGNEETLQLLDEVAPVLLTVRCESDP